MVGSVKMADEQTVCKLNRFLATDSEITQHEEGNVNTMKTDIEDDNTSEIKKKLSRMTDLASKRNSEKPYWFEVGGQKRYVRLNSTKFRAVSLDASNPCGHLLRDGKIINAKTIKSALIDAADSACNCHTPGNKKPEHKVQAYIIWQALTNPKGLPATLDIADHADALWFVTDEIALPPIRADVILLGERHGKYFPVFIELKHGRTTDVGNQVKRAQAIAQEVGKEFCQFLAAATGMPLEDIQMEEFKTLVIWGAASKEGPHAHKMRRDNSELLTIHHSEKDGKPGQFTFRLYRVGR